MEAKTCAPMAEHLSESFLPPCRRSLYKEIPRHSMHPCLKIREQNVPLSNPRGQGIGEAMTDTSAAQGAMSTFFLVVQTTSIVMQLSEHPRIVSICFAEFPRENNQQPVTRLRCIPESGYAPCLKLQAPYLWVQSISHSLALRADRGCAFPQLENSTLKN